MNYFFEWFMKVGLTTIGILMGVLLYLSIENYRITGAIEDHYEAKTYMNVIEILNEVKAIHDEMQMDISKTETNK